MSTAIHLTTCMMSRVLHVYARLVIVVVKSISRWWHLHNAAIRLIRQWTFPPWHKLAYLEQMLQVIAAFETKRAYVNPLVRLLLALMTAKMYHFAYLAFRKTERSTRLLFGDLILFTNMPRYYNLIPVLLIIHTRYLLRVLRYNASNAMLDRIREVIFTDHRVFQHCTKGREVKARIRVQRLATTLVRSVRVYSIVTQSYMVILQLMIWHQVALRPKLYLSMLGVLWIILAELNALINSVVFSGTCHVLSATPLVCLLGSSLCGIELSHARRWLTRAHDQAGQKWRHLNRFFSAHVQATGWVCQLNPIFGSLILSYVALNYVINSMTLVLGAKGKLNRFYLPLALFTFSAQMFNICMVHHRAIRLPRLLHSVTSQLYSVLARSTALRQPARQGKLRKARGKGRRRGKARKRMQNRSSNSMVRSHLRANHFIQAFHTKHVYGITYGNYGLVSNRNFALIILFYLKCSLYIYQLIRGG